MYEVYAKGMILDKYIGYPETMQFELVDGKLIIVMSQEHIEKYPLGGNFEFRFLAVYNTIFLLFKYGDSPWFSAPYSPHLSPAFEPIDFDEGEGLSLSILQVCNEDGKIYDMTLIALTTEFSNLIYCAADMLYQTIPFDIQEHKVVIAEMYKEYQTDEELAEQCDPRFRCVVKP